MIYLETRNDLIKTFEKDLVICEIGVFKGEFSEYILENINPKELHLIDIFDGQMCSGDKDGNNIVWIDLNNQYEILKNKYKDFDNIHIHKGKSIDILKKFEDEYFDIIYIDGDHSFEGVKNDLETSYYKIKNGEKFIGVVRAVDEFCKIKNLNIRILTKDGCPSFCIKKE
jgi:hypothetical protein